MKDDLPNFIVLKGFRFRTSTLHTYSVFKTIENGKWSWYLRLRFRKSKYESHDIHCGTESDEKDGQEEAIRQAKRLDSILGTYGE